MSTVRVAALLTVLGVAVSGCTADSAATDGATSAPQPTATATSPAPSPSPTVDPDAKVIYLTFDDGPWVPYTHELLQILDTYDAKATFFVVGEMVKAHPELIQEINDAGHAIGNHTYNHPMLTDLSDTQIRKELTSTQQVVGPEMGACMRPPYGDVDARVRRVARDLGYRTVLWDEWASDWEVPPVDTLVQRLADVTYDGVNILLHDGGGPRANTLAAVKIMLPKWIKQGYTFQSLPICTTPVPTS